MSERLELILREPVAAHQSIAHILWPKAKALLLAGHELVASLGPVSKTRAQEQHYHALIGHITKQAKHLGAKWSAEDWKRLLLNKFARETGRKQGRLIPSLDGDGVVEVGVLSRRFSKSTANDFIEWLYAWGVENGVDFPPYVPEEPEWLEFVDADTGEIFQ